MTVELFSILSLLLLLLSLLIMLLLLLFIMRMKTGSQCRNIKSGHFEKARPLKTLKQCAIFTKRSSFFSSVTENLVVGEIDSKASLSMSVFRQQGCCYCWSKYWKKNQFFFQKIIDTSLQKKEGFRYPSPFRRKLWKIVKFIIR